jgi:hypothetical protein
MNADFGTQRRKADTLLLVLLACCASVRLYASGWKVETVDAGGGGKYTALAVDKSGNAHATYFNEAAHELKYAFRDGRLSKWFVMTVDDRCAGFPSITLDSKQRPHIAYLEYGTGRLKYARWDGRSWNLQTVRLNALLLEYYTSIALDADDHPILAFYQVLGTDPGAFVLHLRTVRWTGALWQVETIDGNYGSGKFNSMSASSDGSFHLAYANVKDETASLRYARWNGKAWDSTILQGLETAHRTHSVALAVDTHNTPHITYTDALNNHLRYGTQKAGKWQFQTIDLLAREGFPDRNGIAVDDAANVYLSYHDAGRGILKVAYRQDSRWVAEIVDSGAVGYTSSIQIAGSELIVVYYDAETNSLRCAIRPLPGLSRDGHRPAVASLPAH